MKDETIYYLSTQNFHAPKKNLNSYPDKQKDARVALALSPTYEYDFKKPNLKLSIKPPLTSAELASLITCKLKKLIIISGMSSVDDHYTIVGSLSYTEPEHSELKSLHKLREESFTKAEREEQNWIRDEGKTFDAIFQNPERILNDQKLLKKPIFTYADASKHPVCQNFYRDLMSLVNQGGKSEDEINFVGALKNFVEEKVMRNYSMLIERWKKEKLYCIVYENEKDKEILNFEVLVRRLLTENALKEMSLFVVVARTLSPDCLFYKGGKKKTHVGDRLLRAVIKLCYRESPHVMQYVCFKIQQRPLQKTLDDSNRSTDNQSSEEEKQLSSSPDSTDNSPMRASSGFIWNQLTEASREVKPVIAEKKDDSLTSEPNPVGPEIKLDSFQESGNKSNIIKMDTTTFALWYQLTFSPDYSLQEKEFFFNCLLQMGKIPAPPLNNIHMIQKLPPDYSKLAGTMGAFNKHTESLQPVKTSLSPSDREMTKLLT
jgi:hypothetical protein